MCDILYIIQLRESIRLCEDVYKIGKTKDIYKRAKQYPKGSKVMMVIEVEDCNISERDVLNAFKVKFKQRRDLGTEYFEGKLNEMIDHYKSICKKDITTDYNDRLSGKRTRRRVSREGCLSIVDEFEKEDGGRDKRRIKV